MATWTAPRTWTDGEVPTATTMNVHIRDNQTYLYDRLGTLPSTSQSSVSSSRLLSTNYQNTGTLSADAAVYAHMLVSVSVSCTTAGNLALQALVGSTSPPATECAYVAYNPIPATEARLSVQFIVSPGWYYQLASSTGAIYNWSETLFA